MSQSFLTDAEVDDLCAGIEDNTEKLKFLRRKLGLNALQKANGRPLVGRTHFDDILRGRNVVVGPAVGAPRVQRVFESSSVMHGTNGRDEAPHWGQHC